MIAYLIVNSHGSKTDTANSRGQYGDIVEIYPITGNDFDIGTETLNHFVLMKMDLKIPCGDGMEDAAGTFTIGKRGPEFKCGQCRYNDIDLCERTKYLKGEWSGGSIEKPPVLIRKKLHKIDLDSLLPENIKVIVSAGTSKSSSQKETLLSYGKTQLFSKSEVIQKEALK